MSTDQRLEARCSIDLTIVSIFQDEAPYLREWIEFHRMMGVQRFVLVNDRSTDNFQEVLLPYLRAGVVQLHSRHCPVHLQGLHWVHFQQAVLQTCVEQLRGKSRWVLLIDIDEFVVPKNGTVAEFLRDRESLGGVYIRWEPFGTSYVERLSDSELMTECLHLKWKFIPGHEMLGKSIVKPHRVARANIHRCELLPGFEYLDSNPNMASSDALIQVNHYWTRDEHFLLQRKLPRSCRIKGWQMDEKLILHFKHLFNDVPDRGMTRFLPALRRRMFGSPPGDIGVGAQLGALTSGPEAPVLAPPRAR
jgi:hypothetical protein